jgi:ribose transport system permease protein
MLPFAAALAIAGLGQTLVVMQGGIDLSVAGGLSLYVVIVTKYPAGDNSRLSAAIGIAFLAAVGAGTLNGFLIGRMRLNPIVATLGTNALLYGAVLWYTAGIPTTTTARLAKVGGGLWLGIPIPVYIAVATTAVVTAVVKPTAHEGDNYLLPSVAAVVLGGTSLLGGRGNLAATAIAALFLSQLDQFVLALGVGYATRQLVQAAALAVGVALYTIEWGGVAGRVFGRRPPSLAPT